MHIIVKQKLNYCVLRPSSKDWQPCFTELLAESGIMATLLSSDRDKPSNDSDLASVNSHGFGSNALIGQGMKPVPRGIMSLISFNNQSTSLMSAISRNNKYIMLMHETRIFYFAPQANINNNYDFKRPTQDITDELIGI